MAKIRIPISITYETIGITPVQKVIEGLQASEAVAGEAIELLPSFVPGLTVEASVIGVSHISQESPLKEVLVAALVLAHQKEIGDFVEPLVGNIVGPTVAADHSEVFGLLFSIVAIYGASAAKDILVKRFENHKPRQMLNALIADVAAATGKSLKEVRDILEAKYSTPNAFKKVVTKAKGFFAPSHCGGNAAVQIGSTIIPQDVVREIPQSGMAQGKEMARYEPKYDVTINLHAMDRDKANTGWAAVVPEISDRRLKLRLSKEVDPTRLWRKDVVSGDIVVVEKLTAHGFLPQEYQLIRVD